MPLRPHQPPRPRRVPRARLDPIDDSRRARSLLDNVIDVPLRPETVVVVLDDHRCGLAIVTVSDTVEPDHVLHVVETLADPGLSNGDAAALIVASVRPTGASSAEDGDRWFELSDLADAAGLEMVEWFVYGRDGVTCPRDLTGAPPRWTGGVARPA